MCVCVCVCVCVCLCVTGACLCVCVCVGRVGRGRGGGGGGGGGSLEFLGKKRKLFLSEFQSSRDTPKNYNCSMSAGKAKHINHINKYYY